MTDSNGRSADVSACGNPTFRREEGKFDSAWR